MPTISEHDIPQCNMDDDDGMPPLVDNPNPSMTFTFFTDMTPITALSADPTLPFETLWENPVPAPAEFAELSETQATFHGPDRAAHGRKRDASYIPRPPNAFILFRSSFIRSQQVPEKVEGNHSTLSKIIGKYWKTLPREEREVWEAKALVAQAEHRKRYPDWRFRPGANALAKLKVKDGPQASNRKRATQPGRKVKGDPAGKKAKSGDERCAIIADLLVEGKTGIDLEDAVRRWEDSAGRRVGGQNDSCKDGARTRKEDGDEQREVAVANEAETHGKIISTTIAGALASTGDPRSIQANRCGGSIPPQIRAQTPDASHDDRFRIPLTGMFRRSLSAPAGQSSPNQISSHHRQSSLESVFANVSYDIAETRQGPCPSFNSDQTEGLTHAVSVDSIGCLSPLVLPSVLREGAPARWNDPYNLLETSRGLPPSPDCLGLTYTLHTPSVSPVEDQSFAAYNFCSTNADFDKGLPPAYIRDTQNAYCVPKSWTECTAPHEQMPIFIEYAGATNFYDWCVPNYSACMDGTNASYHYPGDDDQFGGLGNDYIRIHAGDCLPAVAY
ncbi:hypothetical protein J3R82DRAFT_7340 [Butyriboletus roseoflavus]|nr:hypothetical protein J3R82DRAFT_7340 [Butyriboletus roseoflavus]